MYEKTNDFQTLLPDNRTTFERGFEEGAKALTKREDVLSWLNDPQLTKVELLDLMAKELGVLDWYYDDSEKAKRDSVEQAASIQRAAGSRAGLVKALKAIGIDAEIEKGDKPYSIVIKTWSPSAINSDALKRISARVTAYKSERDSVSLSVGFKASGSLYSGGVVAFSPRLIVEPWRPRRSEVQGSIYAAGSVTAAVRYVVS